ELPVRTLGQGIDARRGILRARLDGGDRGVELVGGGQCLLLLLGAPPFPAADRGQSYGDAAYQCRAVLAQPGTDAFALFMFIEEVVNRHARTPCCRSRPPLRRVAGSLGFQGPAGGPSGLPAGAAGSVGARLERAVRG